MAVKIRLQRKGRKKAPFYHIVVADARAPRDGRFIEKIGTYNPLTVPATISLQNDRAYYWITVGAQPTDTVAAIFRFKGVMYQKHLQLGVKKGALTQEEADAKLVEWIANKEGSIDARKVAIAKQKEENRVKLDGVAKVKAKPAPVVEEAPAETTEEEAVAVETATEAEAVAETATEAVAEAATEAPAAEETPAAE